MSFQPVGILHTGQLDDDAARLLTCDGWFAETGLIDAAADNLDGALKNIVSPSKPLPPAAS